MNTEKTSTGKMRAYFKAQNIEFSAKRIFIDGLGGMAYGLFASLLIGTIISTVGTYLFDLRFTLWGNEYSLFADANGFAKAVQGAAMAAAIGYAMKAPAFVLYSLLTVGYAANALGGSGGPLSVFFVSLVSIFFGKLVSKRTPVDLIVTPAVTILTGVLAAMLIAPPIGEIGTVIGNFIMWATEMRPFVMGLLVSAVMGAVLTLPISSAAICAAFGLTGLAGGACVAGCLRPHGGLCRGLLAGEPLPGPCGAGSRYLHASGSEPYAQARALASCGRRLSGGRASCDLRVPPGAERICHCLRHGDLRPCGSDWRHRGLGQR